MKQNLTDLFDRLEADELDPLLQDIHADNLDPLSYARIENAALACMPKKRRMSLLWRCIAACIALMLVLGGGSYVFAAEAREYNEAITFFNENDLSTEGLTRGEIKAVYRDITTQSFSYEKTAEVILSANVVGGYEIQQDALIGTDLETLWNNRTNNMGIHYRVLTGDSTYHFQKYDGDTLLWSVDCSEFSYPYHTVVSNGILVYSGNLQDDQALLCKFDFDGNLLWHDQWNNGSRFEWVSTVLENEDGSYAVISNTGSDCSFIYLRHYTADGTLLSNQAIEVTGTAMDAAHLEGGYLVRMGTGEIIKIDREGNLTDSFRYSSEEYNYHIVDIMEFNGNVYLSAYATPVLAEDEPTYGNRTEIARILAFARSQDSLDIPSEVLTPVVQENYTAMLLVCDPDSGVPQEFYSVAGSLGGTLGIDSAGFLTWDVESIASASYSPFTSSFTINSMCCVYRYTFGQAGSLLYREDTGEVTTCYR